MNPAELVNIAALEALIDERIAKAQRPIWVTQRTVEAVVGIPARTYLRLARSGAFVTTKTHRLTCSRASDVDAWLAAHAVAPPAPLPDDVDPMDRALASVGARRVVIGPNRRGGR